MFYVYEWYNTESNIVFYVGKGTKNRFSSTSKRNRLFNEYISSHKCQSRIIKKFDNEQDAFAYENETINKYKKIGECFCNLDNGGHGGVNFVWTSEMRKYKSEFNPMKTNEQKQRMSKENPMKNPLVAEKVATQNRRAVIVKGKEFQSTKEAGLYFNRHPEQIQTWCKRGYDTDKEPCRYADSPQKNFKIKTTCSKAVIIDGVKYSSVASAAKQYGVWSETIIRAIKNNRKFKGHTCEYDNQQPSQGNFDNSTLEGSTTNE